MSAGLQSSHALIACKDPFVIIRPTVQATFFVASDCAFVRFSGKKDWTRLGFPEGLAVLTAAVAVATYRTHEFGD